MFSFQTKTSARLSTFSGLLGLAGMVRWNQKGARFALDALLLLTLPEELTFHVLLALPLLAERKRTLDVNLHPIKILLSN